MRSLHRHQAHTRLPNTDAIHLILEKHRLKVAATNKNNNRRMKEKTQ